MNSIIDISSDEEDFVDESFDISEEWVTELLESVDKELREHDSYVVDENSTLECVNNRLPSPKNFDFDDNPDKPVFDDKEPGENDAMVVDDFSTMACITKQIPSQKDSDDDCLILDGDPDKPVTAFDYHRNTDDVCDDLFIVGEKGDLACRDYPHPRHLCANLPFSSSPHERHCKLCHCYVCDRPAPCNFWGNGLSGTDHCHSNDKDPNWKAQRNHFRKIISAFPIAANSIPLRVSQENCRPTPTLSSTPRVCTTRRGQTLQRSPRGFRQSFNHGNRHPIRSQSFPRTQVSRQSNPLPESFGNQMLRTACQKFHCTSIASQVHSRSPVTSLHASSQSKQLEKVNDMETFRDMLARIEADLLGADCSSATTADINMLMSSSLPFSPALGTQPVSMISVGHHMNANDAGYVSGKGNYQS